MQKTALGSLFGSAAWLPAQMLRIMRMLSFFLFAASLAVSARPAAQTITLSGKDISLKTVFSAIEKQTGFFVLANRDLLALSRPITLTVIDMPLNEFLPLVLRNQPLTARMEGKTIVLARKAPERLSDGPAPHAELPLFGSIPIKGRVLTADGQPLLGANIVVKGSSRGTSTLTGGFFILEINEGDVLEVSSIGFAPLLLQFRSGAFQEQSEQAAKRNDSSLGSSAQGSASSPAYSRLISKDPSALLIYLAPANNKLDEIQITAYGKTTKRLATGSISTVSGEEIQRQPVMSVLEALVGRVPGMVVSPTSGNGAAPINVLIRGKNTINPFAQTDPLYVIDGVPLTFLPALLSASFSSTSFGAAQGGMTSSGENPLLSINPRDVERVDVLKDADATAIYGSRGANGVILITTRKGRPGPARVDVNVAYGPKFNQRYPKMLTTQEYLAIRNEAFRNDGIAPDIFNAPDLLLWDPAKYTDWQRVLVGVGNTVDIGLTLSGGTGQTNYRVSAGYNSQKEIMNNGGKNIRANVTTSFQHTNPNNKFRLSFNNNVSLVDRLIFQLGNLTNLAPNSPDIYNEQGEFNFIPYRGRTASIFPFGGLDRPNESRTFSLNSSLNLSYQLVKGLTVSTMLGNQFNNNHNRQIAPSRSIDLIYTQVPNANFGRSTNTGFAVEPQLAYNTRIDKGNLSVQLVGTYQSVTTRGETIDARDFANDALMKSYNNAGVKDIIEGYKEYKYVSAAGIIRYEWDNKYIVNFNAKRDGSSRFGPGKQFGNFLSAGVAWIASDEHWIKSILPSWVSFIKFRGSIGTTGSDNIGDYEYLSRWASSTTALSPLKLFKYNGMEVLHVVYPLNQEFQWESSLKSDASAHVGFFDNKLLIDLNIYRNVSDKQLTAIPIPAYTGFLDAYANWEATVANTGIELGITASLLQKKDYNLKMNFAISRNRNKLIDFPNIETSQYNGLLKVGESLTKEYLLHYTGIDPMTGAHTSEDYNKDGTVTSGVTNFPTVQNDDRYVAVDRAEKYHGNIGLDFTYKGFGIFCNFYFINQLRIDPYLLDIVGERKNISLPAEIDNNHWRNPGDIVKYPRYTTIPGSINSAQLTRSDAKYVNGSFFQLNSLALSYQFPDKYMKKLGMKGGTFAVRTSNIFVITPFRGLDPQITSATNATPIPRTISTTLQFNL